MIWQQSNYNSAWSEYFALCTAHDPKNEVYDVLEFNVTMLVGGAIVNRSRCVRTHSQSSCRAKVVTY
jgi:hypothetical protein